MLYVKPLTIAETLTLEEMHDKHPAASARKRSHAILLSNSRYKLKEVAKIIGANANRETVSDWIKKWDKDGLLGLIDKPRSGRPKKLSPVEENEVLKYVIKDPRNLKAIVAKIKSKFGIEITKETIKRLCKKHGFSWRRVRKTLKNKRDKEEFEKCRKMIEELAEKESNGEISLYFFDESGITLEPSIPYAWQPKGERIEIPSSRSKRMNILGFINKENDFESFVFEGNIDTSVVIHCFDEFSKLIDKPTVVIIDNASIHSSGEFLDKIEEWNKKGMFIEYLSPYSPELNIIEILWKKIKYEWMPFSAYESYESLKESLFDILSNIGGEYTVQFS